MISTRKLIFISIVLLFVNRAKSGNNNITRSSRRRAGTSSRNAGTSSRNAGTSSISTENLEIAEEVNQYLNYCVLELTTAFQKQQTAFDYLLYAFLNLNTADFETNIFTKAAYAYFYDLLNTAHDIRTQPAIENPRNYCENHYGYQVENCIRNITELECQADEDGIFCIKNLYLNWKKSDMDNSNPINGTEDLSDEDLAAAISRGTEKFPDLSNSELVRRLSDEMLLRDFYNENVHRHDHIEYLRKACDYYFRLEFDKDTDDSFIREEDRWRRRMQEELNADTEEGCFRRRIEEARYRQFVREDTDYTDLSEGDRYRRFLEKDSSRRLAEENSYRMHFARKNQSIAINEYTKQRVFDMQEARYECYGIPVIKFENLFEEYNRRQKVYKKHYAMYLYNQLEFWGKRQLEDEEMSKFQDPENFCTNYLSNHTDYYDFMDYY